MQQNRKPDSYTIEYKEFEGSTRKVLKRVVNDSIGEPAMREILSTAVALSGINYGSPMGFLMGFKDSIGITYRKGGVNDIFGESKRCRVNITRNPQPAPEDSFEHCTKREFDPLTPWEFHAEDGSIEYRSHHCPNCVPEGETYTAGDTPGYMTTAEFTDRFEVIAFCMGMVKARRKADGIIGWADFTHMPRYYFGWIAGS